MKKDREVRIYMDHRAKGLTQQVAAAKVGISEKTARKYEQAGKLPSQLTKARTHRTRQNPFEQDWPWVVQLLEKDWALQASTLFELLCQKHPGQYQEGQQRTFRRHVALWRALHGPDQEVIFEQIHQPGVRSQSDFTNMNELAVTLAAQPFPHLYYHFVLTYSNVEAVSLCFSESFEALAEGLERALWLIGGVPQQHRTDHLSAALKRLDQSGREDFTQRYTALMAHYGMQPTYNNAGVSHENGDVEQSHFRFKQALDQALRVRGSRDFVDRTAYERFVVDLIRQRNLKRTARFELEKKELRPLPAVPLAPCRQLEVSVSRFSTIAILGNIYSVPSRLIGTTLRARVWAERIECFVGPEQILTLPRLVGSHKHLINYRHIIWSLVRKPGAFAEYRWREELFPSLLFRRTYDQLQQTHPKNCDQQYLRILYLAATTSQLEVETALGLLAEAKNVPTIDRVRELVRLPNEREQHLNLSEVKLPPPDLSIYDRLIPSLSLSLSGSQNPRSSPSSRGGWLMSDRHLQLDQMLHQLKLPTFAGSFSSLALKAGREGLSHEAFLYELARLECEQRQQRRIERLLVQSRLPREKTLDKFKLERLDATLRLQLERLSSGKFVKEAINVIAIGSPGVGKSHLVCGVGHQLVAQGQSVLWSRTDSLVQKLLAAKRDLRLPQELARLDRIECLILDDIGYVQQSREEMEVLFTLLAERYERKSVIITTNLVFSEWERIFKDPMTTLAALDRVIHHSVVLDMTGVESYRAQQAHLQLQQDQVQHVQEQVTVKPRRKEAKEKDKDQE